MSTPTPTSKLTVLSLDGGGVRGYSTLLILRSLMLEIQSRNNLPETPKPCDYFDVMAGTSSGGLISIMLGRLRMDIDSTIHEYKLISREIFSRRGWQFPGKPVLDAFRKKPWFDARQLEDVMRRVVAAGVSPRERAALEGRGVPVGDAGLLDEGFATGVACDVFVCAVKVDDLTTALLRSYRRRDGRVDSCTIWKAGRATSAAPLYFPTVKVVVDGVETEFFDGGMKNNNPIGEVKDEVVQKYRAEKPRCVVSVGAGYLAKANGERGFWTRLAVWATGGFGLLGWTLLQLATNTQARHLEVLKESKYEDFRENYLRLNVEGKIANIGIERWDKMEEIRCETEAYLATPEAKAHIARCVELLGKGRDEKGQVV